MLRQNYQYKLELEYQLRQAEKLEGKIQKLENKKTALRVQMRKHAKLEKQLTLQLHLTQDQMQKILSEKLQVS